MGPAEYISEGSDESRLCLVMVCVNRVLINPDPHQLDLEIDGKKHIKDDCAICLESTSPSAPESLLWLEQGYSKALRRF